MGKNLELHPTGTEVAIRAIDPGRNMGHGKGVEALGTRHQERSPVVSHPNRCTLGPGDPLTLRQTIQQLTDFFK